LKGRPDPELMILILTLPFVSIHRKLLNSSEPQFTYLYNGDNNNNTSLKECQQIAWKVMVSRKFMKREEGYKI
jgi:hypothetical protein